MSNGNGDGDDDNVDDLIDEMRNTNRNLEELSDKLDKLVSGITRQAREEAGAEGPNEKIDLWDVGKISPGKASTPEEYVQLRSRTARNDDISVPHVNSDLSLPEFFLRVYRMSGEHLQRIYFALNKEQWKVFNQKLASTYGADDELIEILNPGPSVFGVIVTDKDVSITPSMSHINFTEAYDNLWFAAAVDVAPDNYGSPSEALGLPEDPEADTMFGRLDPVDINESMAKSIDDRRDLSLPDEYRYLL